MRLHLYATKNAAALLHRERGRNWRARRLCRLGLRCWSPKTKSSLNVGQSDMKAATSALSSLAGHVVHETSNYRPKDTGLRGTVSLFKSVTKCRSCLLLMAQIVKPHFRSTTKTNRHRQEAETVSPCGVDKSKRASRVDFGRSTTGQAQREGSSNTVSWTVQ